MSDRNVEIRIGNSDRPFWVRGRTLEDGEGPIMPEPDHDMWGPLRDSYAHLCSDGKIRRYRAVIGEREDIRVVNEIVQ